MSEELKGWKELPIGGIILEAGNSHTYETGSWRSLKPVFHQENCTNCLFCWVYCPDSSVIVKDGNFEAFDYDHCKGCGVCAKECPVNIKAEKNNAPEKKAIEMIDEIRE